MNRRYFLKLLAMVPLIPFIPKLPQQNYVIHPDPYPSEYKWVQVDEWVKVVNSNTSLNGFYDSVQKGDIVTVTTDYGAYRFKLTKKD